MKDVAEKFKSIGQEVRSSQSSSSLFGDTNLSRSISVQTTRIGFYPIICEDHADIAMGIASCLAYLLDQYNEFRVYRVFSKIEDTNDDSEITEEDYQFTLDNWEFAGLDDNVTLFGSMLIDDHQIKLNIHLDMNLTEEQETTTLDFVYSDLTSLTSNLPEIALQIVNKISDKPRTELIITYKDVDKLSESYLKTTLENVFYWNLDLYLYLWGVEWSDEDILSQYREMIELCKSANNEFVVWCVSMMARQVMQIGLDVVGDVIVPILGDVTACDTYSDISRATLSMSLTNMGYITQAVDMIEGCSKSENTRLELWSSIISVYLKANQFQKALENNQLAIELGFNDYRLYWTYHQLLSFAESNDIFVEELLLVDPEDKDINEDEEVIYEIIEALKSGLKSQANNKTLLYTLLKYLVEVEHEDLWTYFAQLVNSDISNHQVRDIIDSFYDLADLTHAFEIIENYKTNHPQQVNAYLYMAQLELVAGESSVARELLEEAIKLVNSEDNTYIEIQHLLLSASFENFESRYSDVLVMLDANKNVPENDVDLLESALEIAPKFADIYVTLARCYLQWDDTETATEVLDDGQENIGKHPRISQLSAQINWKRGKQELALTQLNEALEETPNDIALLAQTARFLIENQQFEDSKRYIERAETIAPSHPEIWNLRKLITDTINR